MKKSFFYDNLPGMSIEYVEQYLRGIGDTTLGESASTLRKLFGERHGLPDIPLPITVFSADELSVRLQDAIAHYKEAWDSNSLTPELVNETWQSFWQTSSQEMGLDHALRVPSCDRTAEELDELKRQNRGVVLLPDEVMTVKGVKMLLRMFPDLDTRELARRSVIKHSERGGSVDVEMDTAAPDILQVAADMKRTFRTQGREGQRLPTYLVASRFSKLVTRHYFDETSHSVLLGSRDSQGSYLSIFIKDKAFSDDKALRLGGVIYSYKYSNTRFRSEGRKHT